MTHSMILVGSVVLLCVALAIYVLCVLMQPDGVPVLGAAMVLALVGIAGAGIDAIRRA